MDKKKFDEMAETIIEEYCLEWGDRPDIEAFVAYARKGFEVQHGEYVPDLVSDNYNDLAVLYVAGPNATWRAWAEARMVVILKKADAWHPELNPNGVNERPISPETTK